MYNVEAAVVAFTMSNDTYTSHVASTSDHSNHAGIEANEVSDLACRQLNLDSIIDFDGWIRVADAEKDRKSASLLNGVWNQSLVQRLKDYSKLTFAHHA